MNERETLIDRIRRALAGAELRTLREIYLIILTLTK